MMTLVVASTCTRRSGNYKVGSPIRIRFSGRTALVIKNALLHRRMRDSDNQTTGKGLPDPRNVFKAFVLALFCGEQNLRDDEKRSCFSGGRGQFLTSLHIYLSDDPRPGSTDQKNASVPHACHIRMVFMIRSTAEMSALRLAVMANGQDQTIRAITQQAENTLLVTVSGTLVQTMISRHRQAVGMKCDDVDRVLVGLFVFQIKMLLIAQPPIPIVELNPQTNESDKGGLIDKEREGMNKGVAAWATFEENWGVSREDGEGNIKKLTPGHA
ncbi:uncharacterized protein F5147DRAFT_761842 [Suillus discolor]|uniref:Uncharacterized protein n=1 Tax=Suillus discolor TaxID=1912936 RepID=A0A9P7JSQ6_9AGAM|nr:uncharacterized protein F5147DRAFT_761842 [Suillus discolor]KAG2105800.1 hypothetical protein F5147DRAFT_761842 [Suillus discolor]